MPSKPIRAGADLPETFREFTRRFPQLANEHEKIAAVVDRAGHLDRKCVELIKVGICLGAGLESALRSHVRRALEQGATEAEVEQVVLLGMNTCGFPRTVAAWQWTREAFSRSTRRTSRSRARTRK
jgi:4-carboxymuconolactone decarboxylase